MHFSSICWFRFSHDRFSLDRFSLVRFSKVRFSQCLRQAIQSLLVAFCREPRLSKCLPRYIICPSCSFSRRDLKSNACVDDVFWFGYRPQRFDCAYRFFGLASGSIGLTDKWTRWKHALAIQLIQSNSHLQSTVLRRSNTQTDMDLCWPRLWTRRRPNTLELSHRHRARRRHAHALARAPVGSC